MIHLFCFLAISHGNSHVGHNNVITTADCRTFNLDTGKCLDVIDNNHKAEQSDHKHVHMHNGIPCDGHHEHENVGAQELPKRQLPLIPYPNELKMGEGSFAINDETKVFTNLKAEEKKLFLNYLSLEELPLALTYKDTPENCVRLIQDSSLEIGDEAYKLVVKTTGIDITAKTSAGLFYGIQTLLQLYQLPNRNGLIPCLEINDYPAFEYRGIMLDVSRHFYSKEFVYKQLDLMAHLKINRFHFHLVDGGGWRIEIKKYPKLTEMTAYRPECRWHLWWNQGHKHCSKDDPNAYGGYYTQEEIKEIIKYAEDRFITIIPEIEMPGHSDEVLVAYPELSCSGKPYKNCDLCIGNPDSLTFMQDVLTEIMELFPSKMIHIGGDEAAMWAWKDCPKCTALREKMGFTSLDELQSYFIKKIDEFITSKDHFLIGWDEILKGGLAPHAKVMSWTGEGGGISAANQGHEVIMCPWYYIYIDHPNDVKWSQPDGMNAPVDLATVYNYHPVPASLDEEHKKFIKGVQGNLWCEYVFAYEHAEYMIWPRGFAVAEIAWTLKERKNLALFKQRLSTHLDWISERGYHPYRVDQSIGDRQQSLVPIEHLARGKKVKYYISYSGSYPAAGEGAMTDGLRGNWGFKDGVWQGTHCGSDALVIDFEVDMEKPTQISEIYCEFLRQDSDMIYPPERVVIQGSSDQKTYETISDVTYKWEDTPQYDFEKKGWTGSCNYRYIRYKAYGFNGKRDWLFTDEIVIQ